MKFLLHRLAAMLPGILVVMFAVFLSVRLIPGDPVDAMFGGRRVSEVARQDIEAQLGLNKPWYTQFWVWSAGVARGDLGNSLHSKRSVVSEIGAKLPHTIELISLSLLLAIPLGIGLGVLAALRPRGLVDLMVTSFSVIGLSMPAFWLSLLALLAFSFKLGWFPTSGIISAQLVPPTVTGFYAIDALLHRDTEALISFFHHMALPTMVLATVPLAYISRMTKSSMLEVLNQPYVTTARSKGIRRVAVVGKHALRNALVPVIIVIGTLTGLLLGGAVLTETIFGLPGMGRLLVDAILQRDFPLIQGCVLIFAVGYNVVTLLTDVICQYIDPKAQYG